MAIDRREAMALLERQLADAERERTPEYSEYKLISQSESWHLLIQWLDEQKSLYEAKEQEASLALKLTGDYSHQNLAEKKALLDISQAEAIIINQLLDKVRHFATEEHLDEQKQKGRT